MIPSGTNIQVLTHYCNDSSNAAWLAAYREMESEGERPEPHPVVMDDATPVLLRRQAA